VKSAWRIFALLVLSALALQLYFLARVALMVVVDPQSTSFQRSEAWRLLTEKHALAWRQQWAPYDRVAQSLKRDARVEKINQQLDKRLQKVASGKVASPPKPAVRAQPKVVGGSTITQQLAKNLFLGGERSLPRKAQEFAITFMLEGLLSKQRILEIYLNNVEWGEGVFGAEAAAQNYFRVGANGLGAMQAAQLAVMLPAPKRFEKRPGSAYVVGRAGTVSARMGAVEVP